MTTISRPGLVLSYITPNWFASVMGTGIVSVAVVGLPGSDGVVRRGIALAFWALATALLIVVAAATATHWRRHPEAARRHHLHPVMAHFYGAVPMALLTVGAATLLTGRDVIGVRAAVALDWVLWLGGTAGGLATLFVIPYLALARRTTRAADAFGGWLMPVVPPTVSASTGALLVPHAPVALRYPLLIACYLLLALSLAAVIVVLVPVVRRWTTAGFGTAVTVPTVWLVLGPLGQSIAATNLLARQAGTAGAGTHALRQFGIDYGLCLWGVATVWIVGATTLTVRTARRGLPFALTWWSFTFPVGTYVTGSAALALQTGDGLFRLSAWVGFLALVGAWAVVASRTVRGICSGDLLAAPPTT